MEGERRARSLHSRTPGWHAISSMPPTCQYVTLVCHAFCSMPRTQKHVASEGDLPSHVGGTSQAMFGESPKPPYLGVSFSTG